MKTFEQLPIELQLPYLPAKVEPFPGAIGLIACGEITKEHLTAYRSLGFPVACLCDPNLEKAISRQQEFFPAAAVTDDYQALLARPDITIVDIATHTDVRSQIVQQSLLAGKHTLSQKPFVEELAQGRALAELARQNSVKLAVNQNARWAPHFSYMRQAVSSGLLGRLSAIRFNIHWDHTWTRGTKFEKIHHLLLYDFAIHWFDLMICLMSERPWQSVYATVRKSQTQEMAPPMIAQVVVDFADAQASLCLDAATPRLPLNQTYLAGSEGSIFCTGPDYSVQDLVIEVESGKHQVPLKGFWFPDGFGGSMAELAASILENRQPTHNALNNLASLELCFAAIESAETGLPVFPGQVKGLPKPTVRSR